MWNRQDAEGGDYARRDTIPLQGETLDEGSFRRAYLSLEVCEKVSLIRVAAPISDFTKCTW